MIQWLSRVRRRISRLRSDADIQDELRVHLELQAEDNLADGMSADEARRRAGARLGKASAIIERMRDQDFITAIESWQLDFVLGFRALRKNPVFSLTAVLTLAFGIGANTAIFALLYGMLLRSLPVKDPQQLVLISLVSAGSAFKGAPIIPYRMAQQLRARQHSFADISVWTSCSFTLRDSEGTLRAYSALLASGNAFSLLGVKPYLGRLISPEDDVRGGPPEGWPAVLSYGFWNERFGADPQIVGKQIKISNVPVTVIGVTPPAFRSLAPGADFKMYFPLQFLTPLMGKDVINTPASFYRCLAIGRLKPGASVAGAENEIRAYRKLLFESIPLQYRHLPFFEKAILRVESARNGVPTYVTHVYSQPLWIMQGLVAVVLLLCCVNVGGLMLSKVYARQREFAVRTAIGAARWCLIRQYLIESFVVALMGAALGAVFAWYGSLAILSFFRDPMMGEPISVRPDTTVFWTTGFCAIGATLLFGTLPAWRAGNSNPGALLASRTTAGNARPMAGRAFVPIQVALSLVLVALATLLSQSLIRIRNDRTGFDVDHVTIQTPPSPFVQQKGEALLDLYQRMVDRLEQMPGTSSAAVTWYTPMTGFDSRARFQALIERPNPPEDSHVAYNAVGPGYFRTMETHILEGREFAKNERAPNVCVLNRSAANYLFPHEQALDRYVRGEDFKDFPSHGPLSCRVYRHRRGRKIRQPSRTRSSHDLLPAFNENHQQRSWCF